MGAAIRLRQAGFTDFIILERNSDVGGTWYNNRYPGCQCDVQSNLYSFSFALNPNWSRTYSNQPEILEYLKRVADDYQLRPNIQFGCDVDSARWDSTSRRWLLETSDGPISAQFLISAHGPLSEPIIPNIDGLESFAGPVFHSARWQHDVDLTGKRVGVVGTGASAIQIVPAIQPKVSQLFVFQRTPAWIVPRGDKPIPQWQQAIFRNVPMVQRLQRWAQYWIRELLVPPLVYSAGLGKWIERWARMHLRKQVKDSRLQNLLRPQYRIGCKRILISNDFYPALQQPNTQLIPEGVQRVEPHAIITADGNRHELDVIVLATGFRAANHPLAERIIGRSGLTLAQEWDANAKSYLGITVPDFPNLFLIAGPNTGIGHTSLVFMIEAQLGHILNTMKWIRRKQYAAFEVDSTVCDRFTENVQKRSKTTTWGDGTCKSWYLDHAGRNTTVWPGFTWEYWWRCWWSGSNCYRQVEG